MLEILVLGPPDLRLDGIPQMARMQVRRVLFLAYVASARAPVDREELAHLFWSEMEPERARVNLRTFLKRLRADGYAPYFDMGREAIGVRAGAPVHVDLVQLETLTQTTGELSLADLLAADALCRGPLFGDTYLDEFPEVAHWADVRQRDVDARMVHVYQQLIPRLLADQDTTYAVAAGAKLVDLAPYDDHSQALYLRALAADGQIARAMLHLDAYRRTMAEEFDGAPLAPELEALAPNLADPQLHILESDPAVALPLVDDVPIIGRTAEIATLDGLLDAGARLISIVGLGGVGKTTLVRNQQAALHDRFAGRVHQLDLRGQDIDTIPRVATPAAAAEEALLIAMAQAVHAELKDAATYFAQVRAALSHARNCLIVDNFETLQAAAPVLARLLAETLTLTVIVTSRQSLHIAGESTIWLTGLQVMDPDESAGEDGGQAASPDGAWSDAATLFRQRVAESWGAVDDAPGPRAKVETLCRQLGGHPLALELAAGQLDFYGLDELLAATSEDMTFLSTEARGHPGDHDNLAVLLSNMWAPLSPAAQQVLVRVAVFAGAFDRAALTAVAPAAEDIYHELRRAALLQVDGDWYSLHPLVRQHALTRLAGTGDDTPARAAHAAHFLALPALDEHRLEQVQRADADVFSVLQPRQRDLFSAWRWAIQERAWPLLLAAIGGLGRYLHLTAQWHEGVALLRGAYHALPPESHRTSEEQWLAGRAARHLATLALYGGEGAAAAAAWARTAITCLETDADSYDLAAAYAAHARATNRVVARRDEAADQLRRALAMAERHGWTMLYHRTSGYLLALLLYRGAWEEARQLCAQVVVAATPPDSAAAAELLIFAGSTYLYLGEWAQAEARLADVAAFGKQHPVHGAYQPVIDSLECVSLAARGEVAAAAARMERIMPQYLAQRADEASLGYGLLAICQARAGDIAGAQQSAAQAVNHARMVGSDYLLAYARLRQVEVGLMIGALPADAVAAVQDALATGRAAQDATLIFTALYAMARLSAQQLPPNLVTRILKIGAISPAMYHEVRPAAHAYLVRQGIEIDPEEQAALWATDLAAVEALVEEVEAVIGRVSDCSRRRPPIS